MKVESVALSNSNENSSAHPAYLSKKLGLQAAMNQQWNLALVYLNQAARLGLCDIETLDALGEAAYRSNTPEALGPFQNYYKYPAIATHMARAFLMLGDIKSTEEFLGYAQESALKEALKAMLSMGANIKTTVAAVLPVAEKHPQLYYPEYWRALAAIADAVQNEKLTRLAERRSKAFAYKDPNIHFNQALRMLGKAEYRAGWRLYDWRFVPGAKDPNRTQLGEMPMWEGENLQGKSIVIFLEQGLGDVLFSLRYIRPLQEQGARVEVVGRKPVLRIIRSSFPDVKVHDEDEVAHVDYWQKTPSADFWVYALSIPARAGLYRPLNTKAFLKIETSLIEKSAEVLQALNKKSLPIVCINWHGRIETESDRTRAFKVEEFLKISGVCQSPHLVISIQKDATEVELQTLQREIEKAGGIFFNSAPYLTDFSATASWILNSERLLTCDTSVSHLSGGLGHPTLVLARNKAIWQWVRKDLLPGQQPESQDEGPAVWYDSVRVRYALTPEISWMFTTINSTKGGHENESQQLQSQSEIPSGQPQSSRFGGSFRFAGRSTGNHST